MLSRFGRSIHRSRRLVIAASLASILLSVLLISQGNEFEDGNSPPTSIESGRALELVNDELPIVSTNSVNYIFTHESLKWNDTEFEQEVRDSLIGLDSLSLDVLDISLAYDEPDDPYHLARHVSRDGHRVAVFVSFNGTEEEIAKEVGAIKDSVESNEMEVLVTGSLIIDSDFDRMLKEDQIRAEIIGIPISLIILLFVFRTVVASLLPMVVAMCMFPLATGMSYFVSKSFPMTEYSVSMITLIGLAVSIDYSLFMISRFREELGKGQDVEGAVCTMMESHPVLWGNRSGWPMHPFLLHRHAHAIHGDGGIPSSYRCPDLLANAASCFALLNRTWNRQARGPNPRRTRRWKILERVLNEGNEEACQLAGSLHGTSAVIGGSLPSRRVDCWRP